MKRFNLINVNSSLSMLNSIKIVCGRFSKSSLKVVIEDCMFVFAWQNLVSRTVESFHHIFEEINMIGIK